MTTQETGPRIVTKETQLQWKDRDTVKFYIPKPKSGDELTREDFEDASVEGELEVKEHYQKTDDALWDILQIQLMNVMAVRKLTAFKATVLENGMMFVTMKFGEEWTAEEKGEE